MSLSFGSPARLRRPNLTPMIDVVFLLLVFFMLASRFGIESSVPLALAGQADSYSGPPRLVTVSPEALTLNGVAIADADLVGALIRLTDSPADIIVLRPADGTALQRIVALIDLLSGAGFQRVILVE